MFLKVIVLIASLALASSLSPAEELFIREGVVPDVVAEPPKNLLDITYPGNLKADGGVELTPTQVKDEPRVTWPAENESDYYTLIMTDPDAPSRRDPKFREFNHWLVGNIPGNRVADGEVLRAFVGSGPPKGTGLHRYVFLVYKQPGRLEFSEPRVSNKSREDRPKFKAADFAKKYNLGEAVAGNLYQAQWDEYVPLLHKQLSGD